MKRMWMWAWLVLLATVPGLAHAAETDVKLPEFAPQDWTLVWIVLGSALVAVGYGMHLARKTTKHDPGSPAMQEVSAAIQQGAMAYLGQQVKTMVWFVVALAIGLYFLYQGNPHVGPTLAGGISLAFLMGVAASYIAGYVGMGLAVRANTRVASAALTSFKKALEVAFQAGTVSGLITTGLGLLGATIIMLVFQRDTMTVLVGFGFGGSLAALFMRVGGGIFTKAADVGADLVGKVEAGIPEDDPRNAATIADNVGDNVGDCAGMAADVFESYEVTLVAAIILGVFAALTPAGSAYGVKLIIYPLLVRGVGVFASIIGTWFVKGRDDENMDPMQPINVGFWVSALAATVGFTIIAFTYLGGADAWRYALATFMGIVLVLVIGRLTEYFTSTEKPPVTEIANSTRTGTATMILTGLAEGMESSVWGVVAIAVTIIGAFAIFAEPILAFYAISLAGLGLLTTTAYLLAMDTFGPITDNANGVFEMSGALRDEHGNENRAAHRIVARLDAVGNTTKALTKGFAIATAVLAATALFGSFVKDAGLTSIAVDSPPVFVGLLIGGAVPFLFSSFAIRAVSRAAGLLVTEVRRQFREIPGIMEGTAKPDYARCVAISTAAAQKELIGPGILAIATPLLVGFALGYKNAADGAAALGGFLAGAILCGQLMAVFQANTGGAWDNAKKKIEDGLFGGKGTDYHKSAVIGDTVGDPLKDTAGPALNPLIKVMNLVAILAAPVLAMGNLSPVTRGIVVAVCLIALIVAVSFSKRKGEAEIASEPAQKEAVGAAK